MQTLRQKFQEIKQKGFTILVHEEGFQGFELQRQWRFNGNNYQVISMWNMVRLEKPTVEVKLCIPNGCTHLEASIKFKSKLCLFDLVQAEIEVELVKSKDGLQLVIPCLAFEPVNLKTVFKKIVGW